MDSMISLDSAGVVIASQRSKDTYSMDFVVG